MKKNKNARKTVLKNTVLAFERLRIQDNLDALDKISNLQSENFKDVFASVNDIEASMFYEITSQRLKVIEKFQKITDDNELERAVQMYLYDHLWLLTLVGTSNRLISHGANFNQRIEAS